MGDFNVDLSEVKAAEEQVAEQQEVVVTDETESTGHKVIFYIILGLVGLSGVGIPILIWLLIREHKKVKQLETAKAPETAVIEAGTEEKAEEKEEPKVEEKAPETKAKK